MNFTPPTDACHEYVLEDGTKALTVTAILEGVGASKGFADAPGFVQERAAAKAEIGGQAHKAFAYWLRGELDESSVPEECMGYLRAACRFAKEKKFVPDLVEHAMVAQVNGAWVGGTVDFTGTAQGLSRKVRGRVRVVGDLKCAFGKEKHWPLQLAGYQVLLHENGLEGGYRLNVHLFPDGTYRLLCYPERSKEQGGADANDQQVFRAAVAVEAWKRSRRKVMRVTKRTRAGRQNKRRVGEEAA